MTLTTWPNSRLSIPACGWIAEETRGAYFGDKRLGRRFANLLADLWAGIGRPIPFACQDWASTKAAYRFLSNEKVSENDILDCHFRSTQSRAAGALANTAGAILILHDTTEFTYKREPFDLIVSARPVPS